ncbi:hypothetical protein [Paenibacillus hexagrammi]|uniref:BIG2 domain-containing protein n=1 Tax=Paenibacillus hexagrammi TaxID=2908839 RepID=A0ABY3SBS8_9BACL|nr:hypothetical protein [Paenibacillus sp. YPD9-1]UJF31388.1 hypothetical protein L0M14_16275 [Paenibacillus sp. YPD9-1]
MTQSATYNNPSPAVAEVSNGKITAKASGTTDVTISFKGELGEAATAHIQVTVNSPVVVAIEAETAAANSAYCLRIWHDKRSIHGPWLMDRRQKQCFLVLTRVSLCLVQMLLHWHQAPD